jgi:hypothetical protein
MGKSGSLLWRIKDSLLDYLAGMPDASVGGTRQSDASDAPFAFTESPESTASRPSYLGRIRITAHDGLMDIDLVDPVVVADGDRWIVTFRTPRGESLGVVRLTAVEERTERGLVLRRSNDVALLMDAAPLFGGNYAPYTRMAPLEFSARLAETRPGREQR